MAFRRPRKTTHSDARVGWEQLHEQIVSRSTPEDLNNYLLLIGESFLHNLDDTPAADLPSMFLEVADSFLTPSERRALVPKTRGPAVVECGNGSSFLKWCDECEQRVKFDVDEVQGCAVCPVCGATEQLVGVLCRRQMPFDAPPFQNASPYKRSNHFGEYLDSFMARQTTPLPDEVMESIYKELKKQRITDYSKLTHKRLRTLMKDLRLNKHYDAVPLILHQLTGDPPPKLSPTVEQELKNSFELIQGPFHRAVEDVAPTRKNFLSYSYCIFKLLQLLELDHLLVYFPLLKSRQKLLIQDKIWQHICRQLNWRYIPSV